METIEELSQRAEDVHVLFNHCTCDAGALGAQGMAALLKERAIS